MSNKLTIIVGKTYSGKTTYINKKFNSSNIVKTHTTRPVRPSELGNEYHFESDELYQLKKENGIVVSPREYNTEFGVWSYWVEMEDIEKLQNPVMILDLEGAKQLVNFIIIHNLDLDYKVLYINTSLDEINLRINESHRGATEKLSETQRRLKSDIAEHRILDLLVNSKKRVVDITLLILGNRV